MDLALLKKLVRIVEQSGVDEIEVEEEGLRVRISKGHAGAAAAPVAAHALPAHSPSGHAAPVAAAAPAPAAPVAETKLHEVKSPIVGTFFRAPAPDADSYVEIGADVQEKSVLCIIEAMKLMNEIESDIAGKVVKILVENGQAVEYNQPLFLIDPA